MCFFDLADKRTRHNIMQALALLAPILSLGWAFAGWRDPDAGLVFVLARRHSDA